MGDKRRRRRGAGRWGGRGMTRRHLTHTARKSHKKKVGGPRLLGAYFRLCFFTLLRFAFCVLRNAFLWGFAFFTFFCVMSRALCAVHLCLVRAWCVIPWFRGAIQTVGVIT